MGEIRMELPDRMKYTILRHYQNGKKIYELAEIYGLSGQKIENIVNPRPAEPPPAEPKYKYKNPFDKKKNTTSLKKY